MADAHGGRPGPEVDGEHLLDRVGLDDEELRRRKRVVGFDEADVERLTGLDGAFRAAADEAGDAFAERLLSGASAVDDATAERLAARAAEYLAGLGGGSYGRTRFADRARRGAAHDEAGLPPALHVGTYAVLYDVVVPRIGDRVVERTVARLADDSEAVVRREFEEGIAEILSVLRLTALDAGVGVEAYLQTYREQVGRELDRREQVGTTIRATVEELRGTARDSADGAQQIAALADEQSADTRRIAEAVSNLSATVEEVATATDDQASSTEEVAAMVDEAARRATDVSEEVDHVATAQREQSAMVAEVEAALERLTER